MSLQDLARALDKAERVVAFTGAGISTESGVPDFRSPGGVWSRMRPILFQEFLASEAKRREAWSRVFTGAAGWTGRRPNRGHEVLAEWVKAGRVRTIITQNVDDLHQASGVPEEKIIELHGNASYTRCLECGARSELEDYRERFLSAGEIPTCALCGGLVKSATISFGQPMPERELRWAEKEAASCDLFLVLGSSLVVFPAAALPMAAKRRGAVLAIVNRDPTDMDAAADIRLGGELGEVLTGLDAALKA